jgi:hypothetical protein
MHSLPERDHIAHMCVSWDGNQRCVHDFEIVAAENLFSIFQVTGFPTVSPPMTLETGWI